MKEEYCPKKIESYVQNHWEKNKVFQVDENTQKEKYYCLSMIPYPSGNLHIGHIRNYTIGDVISRYQRMLGKNVLYPIGWDAFGLPAENAAIKNNIDPDIWTYKNINIMKQQLKKFGFSYDWNREITTCDHEYYRWEQWFFIQLYKKKLAYKKISKVNWCPKDKTVLANEQIINKRCWRCDSKIEKKIISQWFLKITQYAEELLYDLDKLKNLWPKQVITMQRNWIGKSEGIEVKFDLINLKYSLKIYTTQIYTFMGVTFLIISPEHELSIKQAKNNKNIKNFIHFYNKNINDEVKINQSSIKGIYTELNAIHPFTKKNLPIWITNFVIQEDHGISESAMCIPAHNYRDWLFANKYNLEIKSVVLTPEGKIIDIHQNNILKKEKNILFNSQEFDGLNNQKATLIIANKLKLKGRGKKKIKYKIRDWCISRQRYWGTPIPMGKGENNKICFVPEKLLPVLLSKNKKYNLKKTIYINNKNIVLENDTFDTFIESSWYYIRHTCPHTKDGILDIKKSNYWLPIDQYIGGIEHATLHLIYFRFFHKIMRDMGLLTSDEPAKKLLCQGMVVSDTFYYLTKKNEKHWISPDKIKKIIKDKKGNIIKAIDFEKRDLIYAGMSKMSKSKNNGINPIHLIEKYGADTVRLFIMFAAPAEKKLEWQESGIKGIHRFLNKLWNLTINHINQGILNYDLNFYKMKKYQQIIIKLSHNLIQKISFDIDKKQSFNTAIASIMTLTNKLIKFSSLYSSIEDRKIIQKILLYILKMLYPFAPHISFILWKKLKQKKSIDQASWPKYQNDYLTKNYYNIIVQIDSKKRAIIKVNKNNNQQKIESLVKKEKIIKKYLLNKSIKKIFYVPNKVINFITI